ncbi:MAG: DHH family phosphoesterase [Lacrimispora saccharolytica]
MNDNNKIKFAGRLKSYMIWPILLSLLLIAMNVVMYFIQVTAGIWFTVCVGIYVVIVLSMYFRSRPKIMNEMITFAAEYGQVQKRLLQDLEIPYMVMDMQGKLLWVNNAFTELTGKTKQYHKSVTSVFSGITQEKLPKNEEDEKEFHITYEKRDFRVLVKAVCIDELLDRSRMLELQVEGCYIQVLYLFDETELNEYIRKCEDETMVAGLLYLDNYEEVMESIEPVRRSLLAALVERKMNQYFSRFDGMLRRLEKDKYLLVMRRKSLEELKEKRFDILEEVKTVNIGNEMAVTISIGIGYNAGSYIKNSEYARIAIDLALGRGGDQVVMKDGEHIQYFGGKTQAVEKNTRVKARVKAHALKEFMLSKERVVVMGHKNTDADSFGSAIGIYRAAKTLNKRTHIVLESPNSSVRPLMEGFLNSADYDDDMFINCHEARELVDENTLVVVVDVNRPSYTECEDILHMTKTIVVLDHHRQGSEVIRNAVLAYVEPYASSACEMVAEILQYFADGVRIRNIEADSLYAGIMIDTDNFQQKTGVRTFEAAAFLRRCGADVTRVRKLFREDMNDYRAKGETISNAEIFMDCFAISECPHDYVDSPTVVGSQAANELLNVVGVKASFVLTEYRGMIYISARAIDEVNVQIIMERMGGGGHLNMAGCQLEGSMSEAKRILKDTLTEMLEEGEI